MEKQPGARRRNLVEKKERNRRLLLSFQAAKNSIENLGEPRYYLLVAVVLMNVLEHMAGVGHYEAGRYSSVDPSLFDPTVTDSLLSLLITIRRICLDPPAGQQQEGPSA